MHGTKGGLLVRVIALTMTLGALAACGAFARGTEPPPPPPSGPPDRLLPPLAIPGTGPPVEPNPDATWVELASLAGEGNLRSDPFSLSGTPVRLRTNLQGDIALLWLFVVPAGTQQAGGFPDVISSHPGDEETLLSKPPGSYVLDVQSLVGSWSVVVEEQET